MGSSTRLSFLPRDSIGSMAVVFLARIRKCLFEPLVSSGRSTRKVRKLRSEMNKVLSGTLSKRSSVRLNSLVVAYGPMRASASRRLRKLTSATMRTIGYPLGILSTPLSWPPKYSRFTGVSATAIVVPSTPYKDRPRQRNFGSSSPAQCPAERANRYSTASAPSLCRASLILLWAMGFPVLAGSARSSLSTTSSIFRFRISAIPRTSQMTCWTASRLLRTVATPAHCSASSSQATGILAASPSRFSAGTAMVASRASAKRMGRGLLCPAARLISKIGFDNR